MLKNATHRLLNNFHPDSSIAEGWLLACEGWMDCGMGRLPGWDGIVVEVLMREIEQMHGRLRTAHYSLEELTAWRQKANATPHKTQFNSCQVQALILSAMNLWDTAYLYTRDEQGLKLALKERATRNRRRQRVTGCAGAGRNKEDREIYSKTIPTGSG